MGIVEAIILAVTTIGGIAAAIITIWKLVERANNKLLDKIDKQIESSLIKNNTIQEREFKLMLDIINMEQMLRIDALKEDLTCFRKDQQEHNDNVGELIELQKAAILETFKQDIRSIYFKLRDTGELEDRDKAYADKIYHYYQALGGNSDVLAKMEEMNQVYSSKTFEAVEEAKKKKSKARKIKDINLDNLTESPKE